jgi:hypothetical protein
MSIITENRMTNKDLISKLQLFEKKISDAKPKMMQITLAEKAQCEAKVKNILDLKETVIQNITNRETGEITLDRVDMAFSIIMAEFDRYVADMSRYNQSLGKLAALEETGGFISEEVGRIAIEAQTEERVKKKLKDESAGEDTSRHPEKMINIRNAREKMQESGADE